MKRLRILTWHVHGSYLYYLTQAKHDFFLPIKPGSPEGYGGRLPGFDWSDNVHNIEADRVAAETFDCILFQSSRNYLIDQHEILSEAQKRLPRLYLEHDPPLETPTDTKHVIDDPSALLVHVTHYNQLMWDANRTPTCVVDHGVVVPPDITYTGEIPKGIVVVNDLRTRGRRLGADIFKTLSEKIPLDLVGMDAKSMGGLGEISHKELPALVARYRFFFHPIRYTSLGLALCEAMMLGVPIVGLATTELPTIITNRREGFIDSNLDRLATYMQLLLDDPNLAKQLGQNAQRQAQAQFSIERFTRSWDAVFARAMQMQPAIA